MRRCVSLCASVCICVYLRVFEPASVVCVCLCATQSACVRVCVPQCEAVLVRARARTERTRLDSKDE